MSFSSTSGPPSSISVHKGYRIQTALCVDRLPLRFQSPSHEEQWRLFKEAWDRRTNNHLSVDDDIVYMRFHFQFLQLPSKKQVQAPPKREQLEEAGSPRGVAQLPGPAEGGDSVDALVSGEGLDLMFPEERKGRRRRKKVKEEVKVVIDDSDVRSPLRLANRCVFLVVKYGNRWTFPTADRAHSESMRNTLHKLCDRQLGISFRPHLVGTCPFTFMKRKNEALPGIDGRKIFFYRAHHVDGQTEIQIPEDSPVMDYAWLTHEELPRYIGASTWAAVKEGLPLDIWPRSS